MSTIQKYWRKHAKALKYGGKRVHLVIPLVECADGFTMSVQASPSHYSSPPRTLLKDGSYTAWEVLADRPVRGLKAWACGFDPRDDGHYSHVPTQYVDEVIAKHGGLKE
jgi:hypothetical protein